MNNAYNNQVEVDPVCIVSYEGIFPGAKNSEVFFTNLLKSNIQVQNFDSFNSSQIYHDIKAFYQEKDKERNRTSSHFGAIVERDVIKSIGESIGMDEASYTSTEIVSVYLASEVLSVLKDLNTRSYKFDLIVGHASIDNEIANSYVDELLSKYLVHDVVINNKKIRVPREKYVVTTSFLNEIRTRFNLPLGINVLTDAACASSFAAIFSAYNRLNAGFTDFVLTGGIDLNVCPFLQIMFSKAGVLSSGISRPLSGMTDGMNQGEAAVMFLLTKKSIADKLRLNILGYILNCDGGSDGQIGGIIEPSAVGQEALYKKTYKNLKASEVDYIEAHGTGTVVGDRTELSSLENFFGRYKIPVGTVKSNIGHTIAAAGSCSLVKILKSLEKNIIPPLLIEKKKQRIGNSNLYLTSSPEQFKNQKKIAALSSFGFGGTNFHMVVSNMPEGATNSKNMNEIYTIADVYLGLDELDNYLEKTELRIPPVVLKSFDKIILLAMLGVEKTIKDYSLYFSENLRTQVGVISSGALVLDLPLELSKTLALEYIMTKTSNRDLKSAIESDIKQLPEVNENTGACVLNNLIASRVSKAFDYKGVAFHVDSDTASHVAALTIAQDILFRENGVMVLINVHEEFSKDTIKFNRKGVQVQFLATKNIVMNYSLSTIEKLSEIEWG